MKPSIASRAARMRRTVGKAAVLVAMTATGTGCVKVLDGLGVPEAMSAQLLDFLAANPDRSALVAVRNDTVLAAYNPDRQMPLASTVKVIIAVSYAELAAAGRVHAHERVALDDLERFHIRGFDGNAHPAWLDDARERKLIVADSVPLAEVVRGMIRFSSNANAEYLLDRLGAAVVNETMERLGVAAATPLFPFQSAVLILRDSADVSTLKAMPAEMWAARAWAIHDSLRADSSGMLRRSLTAAHASLERQRVWSERLPGSTARAYAGLAHRINARKFPDAVQVHIDSALRYPDANASLARMGFKGGSTASVLTMMAYFEEKTGARTEYVLLLDRLTPKENARLQRSLDFFNYRLITDPRLRDDLKALGGRRATVAALADPLVMVGSQDRPSRHLDSLTPGTRIRVELFASRGSSFGRGTSQMITGSLIRVARDSLVVAIRDGLPPMAIPLATVRGVSQSAGEPSRMASALRAGFLGALIGSAEAALSGVGKDIGRSRRGREVATGAAAGFALGALTGAVRRRERWVRLEMPPATAPRTP